MKEMHAMHIIKKFIAVVLSLSLICCVSVTANAASWYAGTAKWGSYFGIHAKIRTPTVLPKLGSSGESCWVTNVYDTGSTLDWIQTGIRYYSGYSGFRTYVETNIGGVYNMNEIGTHSLNSTKEYRVNWVANTVYWEACIDGTRKGVARFNNPGANVQAQAESHATNTQMGPFTFSSVQYINTNYKSKDMDKAPTADSPYKVSYSGSTYTYYVVSGGN